MRVLDHALKSIVRNKTKTAMIFVMMFTVFSLIFSGVIIQNTITQSQSYIRKEMGLFVEYKINYEKFYEDNNYNPDQDTFPKLDKDLIERFKESKYVEKTHISKEMYQEFNNIKKFKPKGGFDMGGVIIGGDGESFDKYLAVIGTNNSFPVSHEFKKITFLDGEGFSDSDLEQGSKVCYVSESFAKKNDLVKGDELSFSQDGETYKLTINGFFKVKEGTTDENIYNQVIVPNKLIEELSGEKEFHGSVFYQMKSADAVEKFKKEMSLLLSDEYTALDANDAEYEKVNAPLNLMSIITNILVYVIMVAGSLIMMSLITIFVRDRKFEIGLLISSGESKVNVLSQFLIEVLIIGTFAFILAIGTSFIISDLLSGWLVNSQLLAAQPKTNSFEMMYSYYNDVSLKDVAKQFKVGMNTTVIIRMFIVQLILMVASGVVPLLTISRYKPREIIAD